MRGDREPISYWISKGKDRHALLALFINSKLAIVLTLMISAVALAALDHPMLATAGLGLSGLLGALRSVKLL